MKCTRKEFMALAGITNSGHLTTYIKRGKVFVDDDKKIDTERRENKDFLASRVSQGIATPQAESLTGATKKEPVAKAVKEPVSRKVKKAEENYKTSKWEIDLEKAQAELNLKLIQTKLNEQRLSALLGNNLPIEFVKEVVAQLSKALINNYKSFSEQHITEICHKHRINERDRVGLIAKNTSGLNAIHAKAISDARTQMKHAIGKTRIKESETDELGD